LHASYLTYTLALQFKPEFGLLLFALLVGTLFYWYSDSRI